MGLAICQIRTHRRLIVNGSIEHIVISCLSFLVKFCIFQIVFRLLKRLPAKQYLSCDRKLGKNTLSQPGKFLILTQCKPTFQHFLLGMRPALAIKKIINIRLIAHKKKGTVTVIILAGLSVLIRIMFLPP